MNEQDPDPKAEYLRNTHDAYRLFYTVLLTIGLTQGFNSLLDKLEGVPITGFENEIQTILIFFLFTVTVLRFFLEGIRHLDQTYIESEFDQIAKSRVGSQRFRAIDIGLLSFDAGLIIIMGAKLASPNWFFTIFSILLFVDAVWALSISYKMGDLELQMDPATQVKWGINNTAHFGLMLGAIILGNWPLLVLFGFTNSLIDLWWTFDSYFPPLK